MVKLIGNTASIINWDQVIDKLKAVPPAYIGPRHSKDDAVIGLQEMGKLWDAAGFKLLVDGGTAGWDMFFPETHFDKNIVTAFANFLNMTPVDCWISRIHPGNMTPWHWDCNDNEEQYKQMNINRYICFMSPPQDGHVALIEDTCLYYQEKGNVWQWDDRTNWHGGINCGLTPKYLFNFSGIAK